MKKIIIYSLIVSIFTTHLQAGIFGGKGGGGLGKIVGLITKISNTQLKMYTEQINQGINQVEMLKKQAINMLNIDGALTNSELLQLQRSFQTLLEIQGQVKSKINGYKNFEEQFKSVYTEFDCLKDLSPDQYLEEINKILIQSRNIAEDALRTAGVTNPSKMQNDAQRVQALMRAASTVEGQKAAIQANVQMSGMTYQLLNDMKLLLSQSLATQGTIIMERVEKEKMGREEYNRLTQKSVNVDNLSTGLLKKFSDK